MENDPTQDYHHLSKPSNWQGSHVLHKGSALSLLYSSKLYRILLTVLLLVQRYR